MLLRGLDLPLDSLQEAVAIQALKLEDMTTFAAVKAVVAGALGAAEGADKAFKELVEQMFPEAKTALEEKAARMSKELDELGGKGIVVAPTDGKPSTNVDTGGGSVFRSLRRVKGA